MQELREQFEAFLGGDNAAFAELYRELNPRLAAYCHKLGAPNPEDLMQELWERVIAMRNPSFIKRGQEVVNPLAFLFRMLRNLIVDQYRQTKEEISMDTHLSDTTDPVFAMYSETSALEAIILEAFEQLAADDKEVLALNIYSGFKFGEIAEMVGKSVDAVWQQASRARQKLRNIVIDDAARMGISIPGHTESKRPIKEVTI